MFEGLQKKWKVSSSRLFLILVTFAIGGSLTGYLGKKLMQLTDIENATLYIIIYIILVTLLWPMMVLIVSIPFGQFVFFRSYLGKLGRKLSGKKLRAASSELPAREQVNKEQGTSEQGTRKEEVTAPNPKPQTPNPKCLIIFASGAGSNAQKIIDHFRNSAVANVVLIVCNKPGAGVIDIAQRENIPVLLIEKERFFREDGYVPEFQKLKADLIILAGFLWKIPQSVINAFPKRIINIHPALLPKYGGKGMYGQYVHEAVLHAGEMQSGITIHYVDEHYDNGDVIFQTACPVIEGDTPETLAQRIHQLEHAHYPVVVEGLVDKLRDS